MASTEKIAPLPDTLPEDFSNWDGNASPAPSPSPADEWEETFGRNEPAKPHGQTDYLNDILASFEDKSRVQRTDSQSSARGKQDDQFRELRDEASPATLPGSSSAVEPQKLNGRPAGREVILSPNLGKMPEEWPAVSEPIFAKGQKPTSESADALQTQAPEKPESGRATKETLVAQSLANTATKDGARQSPELSKAAVREADEALFQAFSSRNLEAGDEVKTRKNKRLIVIAAGACSILLPLILIVSLGHHGTKAATKPTAQPTTTITDAQIETSTPGQPVSQQSAQEKPSAATPKQQTPDSQPAQEEDASNSSRPVSEMQTQMMNDQLTAPRMISGDMKKETAEAAPPPVALGSGAAEGLGGGAMAPVFNGHSQPVVTSARPVAISSGVANGMLIQKTPPVYPNIAKTARVSGTVDLEATISKTGTIKDLKVVKGPVMLREAALDAVRTWRYKPYKLNNEPTDVETMISVVFTLGN
jgi:TonB family protein